MNVRLGAFLLVSILGSSVAHAAFVASGQVTRFHSSTGQFGVYLSDIANIGATTASCPAGWYYSLRSEYASPDDYKAVMALALAAYTQSKRISLYYTSSNCAAQKFTVMDTVN